MSTRLRSTLWTTARGRRAYGTLSPEREGGTVRTGAELADLRVAAAGTDEIATRLGAVVGPVRQALEQVGAASGQARARQACETAERELLPALRRLRVTARVLSTTATDQVASFRAADGR
ncbi:MAG: hypothetical protein JWM64_2016 [Frankiales bacterium]|nr:hypothetical protein [Frankiales bacterium]